MPQPPLTTLDALLQRYDRLLLDAYGVLVDDSGALPGAVAFIDRLLTEQKSFLILSNSASRSTESMAEHFQGLGLAIPAANILSSGQLLQTHFQRHALSGCTCLVLGTGDSAHYVEQAGGRVLPLEEAADAEVVVLADQAGFACLDGMNRVLNLLIRRLKGGRPLQLILCNPDLIYPVADGRYHFTAGALAAMLEAVLGERFPAHPGFVRLGKPNLPIFFRALQGVAPGRAVMIGDQLATDVLGANRAGIDSVLLGGGVSGRLRAAPAIRPTWTMQDLCAR